jgi:hypothetical protein
MAARQPLAMSDAIAAAVHGLGGQTADSVGRLSGGNLARQPGKTNNGAREFLLCYPDGFT